MIKKLTFFCFAVVTLSMSSAAYAQDENTGSVCVIAYEDTNSIMGRQEGEVILLNVNLSLEVNPGVVIANHVTVSKEPFCFENLTPQQYTLKVDSPIYEAADPVPYTFLLSAGERVLREFGTVRKADTTSTDDTILNIPLTVPVRLGLSGACAGGVMAVLAAFGLFIYGVFLYPRKSNMQQPVSEVPNKTATLLHKEIKPVEETDEDKPDSDE